MSISETRYLAFDKLGRVVKNTLDIDGDLAQVQSKKLNGTFQNYANAFTYTSAGAVSSLRLSNGKFENTTFNSRLQPTQIGLGSSATSQNLLKLSFEYGTTDAENNGNVTKQTITVPTIGTNQGFTATQNYTYDSLNRLKSAVETIPNQTGWKQTFIFDRYGNRTFDTANNNTNTLLSGCPVNICNPSANTQNNKLIGTNYDEVGNTKIEASGQSYDYDAENKQVQVNNTSGIVGKYFYDGDGKRVKKFVPSTSETTIFVYDAGGKMVAEYSTVTASQEEAKISYLTNDHLGSPRITTDATGKVVSRRDFMPFGEEVQRASYGSDSVRQKFTGYERDNETNLDYAKARMFGSGVGRFTSPDDFKNDTHTLAPQSWNLYSYVRNNPLQYVDRNGREIQIAYEVVENGKSITRFTQYDPNTAYSGNNAMVAKTYSNLNILRGTGTLGGTVRDLAASTTENAFIYTGSAGDSGSDGESLIKGSTFYTTKNDGKEISSTQVFYDPNNAEDEDGGAEGESTTAITLGRQLAIASSIFATGVGGVNDSVVLQSPTGNGTVVLLARNQVGNQAEAELRRELGIAPRVTWNGSLLYTIVLPPLRVFTVGDDMISRDQNGIREFEGTGRLRLHQNLWCKNLTTLVRRCILLNRADENI